MPSAASPSPELPSIPGLELLQPIGEGGMSTVYQAAHRNLQRTVAVKILPARSDEEPCRLAWLRESRVMAALAHPHVVPIHDAGEVQDYRYLVMEYMAGGSLRTRMNPGQPWSLARAMPVLKDIAAALDHIHQQGILHLDLKPENILYNEDGQVKITDFGLSRPQAEAHALLDGQHFQGTLAYCAPEYRSGLALDCRYDVFSLATIAYEMLTGQLPGRVYVPASDRNPTLPLAVDAALRRGLARDPDERYSTVLQLQQALARARRSPGKRLSVGVLTAIAAFLILYLLISQGKLLVKTPPESPSPRAVSSQRPDRLVILYDRPEDLAFFEGNAEGKALGGSGPAVERYQVEDPPRELPSGLPLPVWPLPRPALVVHSPGVWGVIHPLQDRSLGQRVVAGWGELLERAVPPEKNLVKAGGFDGECLTSSHKGELWRVVPAPSWDECRQITLDRSETLPHSPALLLTGLDPERSKTLLGCYQTLQQKPPPGSVLVLRFKARSQHGKGSLAVYASLPVILPENATGPVVRRVRTFARALPPDPDRPGRELRLYRSPGWVIPEREWRTYLVITEVPPFPTQGLHRNLVIDLAATHPGATDQVWVDDVELFVWPHETNR